MIINEIKLASHLAIRDLKSLVFSKLLTENYFVNDKDVEDEIYVIDDNDKEVLADEYQELYDEFYTEYLNIISKFKEDKI